MDSATSADPKWKVVYGTVSRGSKYTTFHVEVVRPQNNLRIFRRVMEDNIDLEMYPLLYGHILDQIVHELDKQLR